MIYPIIFPTFLLSALGRPVDPEVNITYSSSVVAGAVSGGSGSCWKSKSLSKSSSWSFLPRQAFSTWRFLDFLFGDFFEDFLEDLMVVFGDFFEDLMVFNGI